MSAGQLKVVEEEIVSKNGEIRVLRDSLKGAHQEKETQRQALALLERQKQREQSDKEKELNKKASRLNPLPAICDLRTHLFHIFIH